MISPVKIWRNQHHIAAQIGATGSIVTWTTIRVPPEGYADQAPYSVVLVEFPSGDRMPFQLVDSDAESIHIGQSVRCVVRRMMQPSDDGVIAYGIKVVIE
jgi:uncharacterized OB-fold protein